MGEDDAPIAIARRPSGGAHPSAPGELGLGAGRALDPRARATFERGYGVDLGAVRVHSDPCAAASARALHAQAFTVGNDVVFAEGAYQPHSPAGRELIAHELAHVVQQSGARQLNVDVVPRHIQRKLGDGHDLRSPRFSKIEDLEAVYDGEKVLKVGDTGFGVQAVQQALFDLGFAEPNFGADDSFGAETQTALKRFQASRKISPASGQIDGATIAALDARFATVTLPPAATLGTLWTGSCVQAVICQLSPHVVDILSKIKLESFDSISWADEKWDGTSWVVDPFPGGGYNTGKEIGVLNTSCKNMAQTLYHEALHAEQPKTQKTTLEREAYAYRIGEEFAISAGLAGRPTLRTTTPTGRETADPKKVEALVASVYPAVGVVKKGEEVLGKVGASDVKVQRPDGSIYVRPEAVGEKVPGKISTVNEKNEDTSKWKCP
jgi:hypothetical protein